MSKKYYCLLISLICFALLQLETFAQSADEIVFIQKMKQPNAESKAKTTLNFAKSFLDKPYKAGTLEVNQSEQLVCNLRDFDCWTFVESSFALALTKYSNKPDYESYNEHLTKLRYRNGEVNGYGSRLHYFIEWLLQAENNGLIKDVTKEIGGEPLDKEINYMYNHRTAYPKLIDNKVYAEIGRAESKLNKHKFFYIPKANVVKVESKIQEGDIIAITSNVSGLDCNHEGFAIKKNGRIHLLHASLEQKKVVISDEPLADYLNRIKKHSGIIVARIQ